MILDVLAWGVVVVFVVVEILRLSTKDGGEAVSGMFGMFLFLLCFWWICQ